MLLFLAFFGIFFKTIAADIASVKEMIDMLPAKISVPQAQDALQDKQDIPAPGIPVESSREAIDAIRGVDGKTTKMTNGKGLWMFPRHVSRTNWSGIHK